MPGFYAAGLYVNGMVVEAALQKTGGKTDDKDDVHEGAAGRSSLTDTPRGPIKFDHLGNVIGDFFIRRIGEGERHGSSTRRSRPTTNVSQFWTYDEKKFLAQPVYSRDYPPLKNC